MSFGNRIKPFSYWATPSLYAHRRAEASKKGHDSMCPVYNGRVTMKLLELHLYQSVRRFKEGLYFIFIGRTSGRGSSE